MEGARLLIGDDEADVREALAEILSAGGHTIDLASDGGELLEKSRAVPYDLLLVDLRFPPTDGITLLKEVKRTRPSTLVVVFTGHATVSTVLDAFRGGAFDVLEKPVDSARLLELAERAVKIRGLGEKRRKLAEELENERLNVMKLRQRLAVDDPFQKMVGSSPVIQGLVETLREVARTDCTVLLTGESGTGKGLAAHLLHEASARAHGPFVEANCVVYAEGVLHSELFGHERGAFTGAARAKKGRFELASGGTLFLDEIGEISPATQLLLLKVLQERTFERVGGEQTLEADVRLIAATNRDLQAAIREGRFRSDLFYRLNVIPVRMPALRERPDDIPLLIEHLVAQNARQTGREVAGFSEEAMATLARYSWPGNVRELENMVQRLVVLNRSGEIRLEDLPAPLRQSATTAARGAPGTLQEVERLSIIETLRETSGNKKLAAQRLGIHRSTLYDKMRRYGLLDGRQADEAPCREERRDESESPTLVPTT